MVRDVERLRVYLEEEPLATIEPAANIGLRNVVTASCDASANPRDGEVRGWELDEVEHRPETEVRPTSRGSAAWLRPTAGREDHVSLQPLVGRAPGGASAR